METERRHLQTFFYKTLFTLLNFSSISSCPMCSLAQLGSDISSSPAYPVTSLADCLPLLASPLQALLRVQLLVDFCSWLTSVPQLGVSQVSGRFVHTSSSSAGDAGGTAGRSNGAARDEQEVSGETNE